jgi:hypothetical protein
VIPQAAWTGSEFVVWGGWGEPIAAAYDPTADHWRDLPSGPLDARAGQAVVAWSDRVAVVGGQTQDLESPMARYGGAVLDPVTGEWTQLPDLPSPAVFVEPGPVVAVEADGRLFVVSMVVGEAYVLDPDGAAWRNLGAAGFGYLQPLGVAGGRWLFLGRTLEGRAVAVALDLTSERWARAAAPPSDSASYYGSGTGDAVLAVSQRFEDELAPPVMLSWSVDRRVDRARSTTAGTPLGCRSLVDRQRADHVGWNHVRDGRTQLRRWRRIPPVTIGPTHRRPIPGR